ncbi:Uncharacterised protein [Kingella potus]|uniref:Uncharacterized protein n=2 Tax=Kingella potus TaxID=265175 RepID=A0A377QZF6_9NEIS|nr:hypothetical protein [Kingella potus]UOP01427.1 hypothetical protein LVJ84_04245 [Kingella potus]STR00249.1 Uncharacterised protein [Kingella potus]
MTAFAKSNNPDLNNVSLQTLVEYMVQSNDKQTFLKKSGLVWERKTDYHGYYSLTKEIDPVGYREAVIRLKGWPYSKDSKMVDYPYQHYDKRKMLKNYLANVYFSVTFHLDRIKSIQVMGLSHCVNKILCRQKVQEQFSGEVKLTRITKFCNFWADSNFLYGWTDFYKIKIRNKTVYLMNDNSFEAKFGSKGPFAGSFELIFTYQYPKDEMKKFQCVLV